MRETCGPFVWLGPLLFAAVPETGHNELRFHATLANTSATLTERADQAGMRAPTKAVPEPIARPHHTAFTGMKNFEKKAIGKLIPPNTLSTSRYVPPALARPERAPISTASPNMRAST